GARPGRCCMLLFKKWTCAAGGSIPLIVEIIPVVVVPVVPVIIVPVVPVVVVAVVPVIVILAAPVAFQRAVVAGLHGAAHLGREVVGVAGGESSQGESGG